MSWIYNRVISVSRQPVSTGGGVQPYSGMNPSAEQPILTDIKASIQLARERGKPEADVPADREGKSLWKVFFRGVALGAVKTNDIITDDLGVRYQVVLPWWDSFGYNLLAERLEA